VAGLKEDIEKGPNMGGFANEYYKKELANMPEDGSALAPETAGTCFKTRHSPVMYIYRKEQTPVFATLMLNFGCSDTHFSSCPCQTWPNRLFAACGTAFGYYNNLPYVQPEDEDGNSKNEVNERLEDLLSESKVDGAEFVKTPVEDDVSDNELRFEVFGKIWAHLRLVSMLLELEHE